jgi:hypothetical protein
VASIHKLAAILKPYIPNMNYNKILAIAINEYDDPELNKIENCKQDVDAVISTLTAKYSFEDVEYLFEKNDTTRRSLYNKIRSFFSDRLPDENVLLLFAGHGQYDEKLETTYWQPSDADRLDSSTWFNIADLMAFIKASEAFHIGIISDSCFSGGIFKPPFRGGGIEAFNTKKSRMGLSSGSIEKVSDGKKGVLSPFANILIKELEDNTAEELPFNLLATNIIIKFDTLRIQTPMCGPLESVGHEGGSFIFTLKNEEKPIISVTDDNTFLSQKFEHLFIPVSESHLKLIEKIKPIAELKNKAVKAQNYMDAAKLRDEEKDIEKIIFTESWEIIPKFFDKISISEDNYQKAKELDKAITLVEKTIPKKIETYQELVTKMKKELMAKGTEATSEEKDRIKRFSRNIFNFLPVEDPAGDFFNKEKDNFLNHYRKSILDIYSHLIILKANSTSKFLDAKLDSLQVIMNQIYKLEVNYLIRGFRDNLDETITIKEYDMKLLQWIKNDY